MLKFAMKKCHLNFTEDLLTSKEVMDENEDDDTSLQQLLDVRAQGWFQVIPGWQILVINSDEVYKTVVTVV